jgi:hypothetical protein
MKNELDKLLCEKYPKIFKDRNSPMTETCMCWGFEHGDGWFNIIDQLCGNIQHHIDWTEQCREREVKRGQEGESGMPRTPYVPQVVASQVKEKFGTLRFYYSGGDDHIDGLVSMAESMSGVTCEVCGSPGVARGGGWIRTLCDLHAEGKPSLRSDPDEQM